MALSSDLAAFITSWAWEPLILLPFLLLAALYAVGWRRLSRREGWPMPAWWKPWCFGVGLLALPVALLSPIGVFSELFFFLHMTQHMLLMVFAAPLILLGSPVLPILWALPDRLRDLAVTLFSRGSPIAWVFNMLTHPLVALPLYIVALAVWHIPVFYDAAQGRTLIHDLEHMVFLGTALLFWWPVINPMGGPRRMGYLATIPYLLPPMLVGNLIGAVLTFADHPLYDTYLKVPRLWGISVVQDQQLGGLIMWVPGGMVYIVPILVVVALLFKDEKVDQRRGIEADYRRREDTLG